LHVSGEVDAELLASVQQLAADMLSNGVIEDVVSVQVSGTGVSGTGVSGTGVAGETR
jgi:phosphoribosylformylglycinamidine synthase